MDILAGIFLTIAYIMMAMGQIYIALFIFLLSNICFLFESIQHNSIFGVITIGIGILLEIYVLIKFIADFWEKRHKNTDLNEYVNM
jgi:hypothetical protein